MRKMNDNTKLSTTITALALLVFGCGQQYVDPGKDDTSAKVDAGSDSGFDTLADSGEETGSNTTPYIGPSITVQYAGQAVEVDIGSIETSIYKGKELVRLSDVWDSSRIDADRQNLFFEFVGSDGFKPSDRGCDDVPGTALDRGYINPMSRKLTWEESLGFYGCYSVSVTVEMNAHLP